MNGITLQYKVLMLCIIAVPKLVLSVLLALAGGNYIIGSPDRETLILNTLAITFIVEVDEFLYKAFTSPPVQEHLENSEPVTVVLDSKDALIQWFFIAVVYWISVIFSSFFVVVHFKKSACSSYIMP